MKLVHIIMSIAALVWTASGAYVRRMEDEDKIFDEDEDKGFDEDEDEGRAYRLSKINHVSSGKCLGVASNRDARLVSCSGAPRFKVIGGSILRVMDGQHKNKCLTRHRNDARVANCNAGNKNQQWIAQVSFNEENEFRIRNRKNGKSLDPTGSGDVRLSNDNPDNYDQRWYLPDNFW